MTSAVLARMADAARGNQAWRVANRRGAAGGRKLAAKLCRETLLPIRRGNLLGHASAELKMRFPMTGTGD